MSSRGKIRQVDPVKYATNPLVIGGLLTSLLVNALAVSAVPREIVYALPVIVLTGFGASAARLLRLRRERRR
jgi:hypothetical protein